MKQKMLLLCAVLFGFLAFLMTYGQINAEKKKLYGYSEKVYVIELRKDKAAGEEIRDTDIRRAEVERFKNSSVGAREIPWARKSDVIGRKLESSLPAGTKLQDTDLKPLDTRQGFTALVTPGYRAVSIPVDNVSSVSNLVRQNNTVDIIGTFRFPTLKGDASLDTVTMTILQNVKVLAVGSRYGDGYSADSSGNEGRSYSTVTLMLLPSEVEMVVFASQKGRLSLSLRNYDETAILPSQPSIDFKRLEKKLSEYNKRREEIQRNGR